MGKKKKLTGEDVFRSFMSLSKRAQEHFVYRCLTPRSDEEYQNAVFATCSTWLSEGRKGVRRELSPEVKKARLFDRRGTVRTAKRKQRIAELRDEHGLTAQEIYDNHREELRVLNHGKRVSIATILKDYYVLR